MLLDGVLDDAGEDCDAPVAELPGADDTADDTAELPGAEPDGILPAADEWLNPAEQPLPPEARENEGGATDCDDTTRLLPDGMLLPEIPLCEEGCCEEGDCVPDDDELLDDELWLLELLDDELWLLELLDDELLDDELWLLDDELLLLDDAVTQPFP